PACRLSVLAVGHFDQVVAELGLDRALHDVDRRAEDHRVELLDHLAGAEGAQVAAVAAGGAGGVFARDLREIGAAFDGGLELVALLFSRNQDMAGARLGHGCTPWDERPGTTGADRRGPGGRAPPAFMPRGRR